MKLIRNKCFETNSSSCHSISIARGDVNMLDSITPGSNGIIELDPMEFGWEEDTYYDAISKLTYAWIVARDWSPSDDIRDTRMQMIQRVVCEHTKAESVVFLDRGKNSWDDGYIDHQSVEGDQMGEIFQDDLSLRDFVFNAQSYLVTDNDNH